MKLSNRLKMLNFSVYRSDRLFNSGRCVMILVRNNIVNHSWETYTDWNVFKHHLDNTERGQVIHDADFMKVAVNKLTKDIQDALATAKVTSNYAALRYMNIPQALKDLIKNKNRPLRNFHRRLYAQTTGNQLTILIRFEMMVWPSLAYG